MPTAVIGERHIPTASPMPPCKQAVSQHLIKIKFWI